jgi:catechol 2,3-dioxygenase-like lactoylglutathione lyase family enzyme
MTKPQIKACRSTRDVIVRTETFAQATQFYETVLGFEVTMRRDGLVGFETGAFQLFLEDGAPAHGPVFEMRVPDLPRAKRQLLDRGCTVVEEDPAVPRCYLRDPFGLVFNVEQQ